MSSTIAELRVDGATELAKAVADYRTLIKDDAGKALSKAARETAFAARQLFRAQPPRPRAGRITSEALGRGFRVNPQSASYLTGMRSAEKILGGAKSGYFQVSQGPGAIRIAPVLIGRQGRIISSERKSSLKRGTLLTERLQISGARTKDLAAYRKLLTQADRSAANYEKKRARTRALLDSNRIPAGAVQLNKGNLAVIRALSLRESAARGGYLGAQFLMFRAVRGPGESVFRTRDKKLAGAVSIKADAEGNAAFAQIVGYLPGSAKIAQREGIINKALLEAARSYRADMQTKLAQRAAKQFGRAA